MVDKRNKSVKEKWIELKNIFSMYSEVRNKKITIAEYLDVASPYIDELIFDFETEILVYKNGFVNLSVDIDDRRILIITIVLIFENKLNGEEKVKKEIRHIHIDDSILKKEELERLNIKGISFAIRKD